MTFITNKTHVNDKHTEPMLTLRSDAERQHELMCGVEGMCTPLGVN